MIQRSVTAFSKGSSYIGPGHWSASSANRSLASLDSLSHVLRLSLSELSLDDCDRFLHRELVYQLSMYRKLDLGDWLPRAHRNGSLFVCSSTYSRSKWNLHCRCNIYSWHLRCKKRGVHAVDVKVTRDHRWSRSRLKQVGQYIYRVWYIVIPGIPQRVFLIWQASDLRSLRKMVNNICCFCCTRLQDLFEQQRTGKMTSPTRGGKMAPWRWKLGNHKTSAFHVMTWCVELEENPRSEHKGAF